MWANIGWQQFHLVLGNVDTPTQVIRGTIGLVLPDLAALQKRLKSIEAQMEGTMYSWGPVVCDDWAAVAVTGPWGNRFVVHAVEQPKPMRSLASLGGVDAPKMRTAHHRAAATFAVRGGAGIRYVEFEVGPGCAARVAKHYTDTFACPASVEAGTAAVTIGPGVHLLFTETAVVDTAADEAMRGVHLCIYISNFTATFDALHARGLTWTNPRFKYLDRCDTKEDAAQCYQFRTKDFVDDGGKFFELEHETRTCAHAQFFKHVHYTPK